MNLLPPKQPHEQYVMTVDFQSLVGTAAVTYANAHVTVLSGTVDDASNIVLTSLTSDGAVNLTVRRGTDGQDYGIRVLVSDANGQVFEEDLVLRVRSVLG